MKCFILVRDTDTTSAWIPNTDLTPLTAEECKDVAEKGKSKALIAAYQVAAENHDLQHFKEILAEHENALQAEAEKREQREAEKVAKADRKKRKSDAAAVAAADRSAAAVRRPVADWSGAAVGIAAASADR